MASNHASKLSEFEKVWTSSGNGVSGWVWYYRLITKKKQSNWTRRSSVRPWECALLKAQIRKFGWSMRARKYVRLLQVEWCAGATGLMGIQRSLIFHCPAAFIAHTSRTRIWRMHRLMASEIETLVKLFTADVAAVHQSSSTKVHRIRFEDGKRVLAWGAPHSRNFLSLTSLKKCAPRSWVFS